MTLYIYITINIVKDNYKQTKSYFFILFIEEDTAEIGF